MTVNLLKHRDDIMGAYEAVIDVNSATDWALFGYESNSNVLKFLEKGEDGIQELSQAFNSGQVMYALCSMTEPKTHMKRLVLINWQGEGAPVGRLGICASHHQELKRLFKGVHMVHTARCEDDVDPDEVLVELKKCATASAITASHDVEPPQGSVGTNYRRINPRDELATSDRDQFWQKTEEEEKARIVSEKRRLSQEAVHYQKDKEILQKEITTRLKSPTSPTASFGFGSKPAGKPPVPLPGQKAANGNITNGGPGSRNQEQVPDSTDDYMRESEVDKERRMKSDTLRQERVDEAKNLIGQRSNVRAMWETTTSGRDPSTPGSAKSNGHSAFSNSSVPPVPTKAKSSVGRKWPPDPVPSEDADQNSVYEPPPPVHHTAAVEPPIHNQRAYSPPPVTEDAPGYQNGSNNSHLPPDQPITPPESPKASTPPPPVLPSSPPPSLGGEVPRESSPLPKPLHSYPDTVVDNTAPVQMSNNIIKSSISNVIPPRPDSDEENDDDQNWDDPPLEDGPVMDAAKALNLSPAPVSPGISQPMATAAISPGLHSPKNADMGVQAQALWDYQASDETEISFDPGDIITRIEMIDEGWWQGLSPDGTFGLFPANYVELLSQ